MEVLVKKQRSMQDIIDDMEAPGRPHGKVSGGWIDDLCELHKVITLCSACNHKWQGGIRKYGYVKDWEFPRVMAKCDDCRVFTPDCNLYFWEGIFKVVRSTVDERRALARSREQRVKRGYL